MLLFALLGASTGQTEQAECEQSDCCLHTPDAQGHVDVPGGVTSVPARAFQNCWSLVSIAMPDGVTTIGGWAFSNTSLASVTLPKSTTTLGEGAFECSAERTNLTSVILPSGITRIPNRALLFDRDS